MTTPERRDVDRARRALLGFAAAAACKRDPAGAGDHGHDHGAGEHGAEGKAEEPEPLAITRWTDRHELFVEFPPPRPGKPVPYHAHVTRLDGFQAVTEGTFHVRFRAPSGVVAETSITGIKRPGIFTPEGPAPAAGTYTLEMAYEHEGKSDAFDCGPITVADPPPAQPEEASGGAITFLKESQWKIPFGTAWAEERALAKEIELAAAVEPAAGDQLTIGAPTGGRFFHDPKLALAEGLRIEKGDVLGSIAPTVAGDDYSRLQLAAEEARLARDEAEREIARIEPLVKDRALARAPPRRGAERARHARGAAAPRRAARAGEHTGRRGRARDPLDARRRPLRRCSCPTANRSEPGAPLVRLGGTATPLAPRAFRGPSRRPRSRGRRPRVRLASGERVDLSAGRAHLLSTQPVVDPTSRIATWIVDVSRREGTPPASPDLRPGASVVLSLRLGEPRPALSVPREAVVDINTRPYVFVQVDGEHFEKRAVSLGDADGAFVAVTSGVAKGERVVTRGGFDVHLASLVGVVESHRH